MIALATGWWVGIAVAAVLVVLVVAVCLGAAAAVGDDIELRAMREARRRRNGA